MVKLKPIFLTNPIYAASNYSSNQIRFMRQLHSGQKRLRTTTPPPWVWLTRGGLFPTFSPLTCSTKFQLLGDLWRLWHRSRSSISRAGNHEACQLCVCVTHGVHRAPSKCPLPGLILCCPHLEIHLLTEWFAFYPGPLRLCSLSWCYLPSLLGCTFQKGRWALAIQTPWDSESSSTARCMLEFSRWTAEGSKLPLNSFSPRRNRVWSQLFWTFMGCEAVGAVGCLSACFYLWKSSTLEPHLRWGGAWRSATPVKLVCTESSSFYLESISPAAGWAMPYALLLLLMVRPAGMSLPWGLAQGLPEMTSNP